MLLNVPCKAGNLQVDETTLRVVAPFKKVVWEASRESVQRITVQPGSLMVNAVIHTTSGPYPAEMLSKPNADKLLALFPDVGEKVAAAPRGSAWYHDNTRLTYVATYTKEKDMQKEVEAAAQFGWMPQGTTATAGHINVGRTAAKVVLTGGVGLILGGASRSKDKITITFVRTPEWTNAYRPLS